MTLDKVLEYIDNASFEEWSIIERAVEQARVKKLDDRDFGALMRQADECVDRMLASDRRCERTSIHLLPGTHERLVQRLIEYIQSGGVMKARVVDDGRKSDTCVIIEWQ